MRKMLKLKYQYLIYISKKNGKLNNTNKFILFCSLLIVIILTSCNITKYSKSTPKYDDIRVVENVSTIVDGENNTKFLECSIILKNFNSQKQFIEYVKPIFSTNFNDRAVNKEIVVFVEKEINTDDIIEVSFRIEFNGQDLSKEDLTKLEPYIDTFNIITK